MIRYTSVNPREAGYEHERNDCTVRALKHVTGVPYRDAHAMLRKHGRPDTKGIYYEQVLEKWEREKTIIYGFRVRRFPLGETARVKTVTRYDRRRGGFVRRIYTYKPSLGMLMHKLQAGRYIVIKRAHAFAIVDGTAYDLGRVSDRWQVCSVWQFEASAAVEARELGNKACVTFVVLTYKSDVIGWLQLAMNYSNWRTTCT